MGSKQTVAAIALVLTSSMLQAPPVAANEAGVISRAALGERPYRLVESMPPGALKQRLQQCADGPFRRTLFSIGHRGAPLRFPEHTRESYAAAVRMGAGIVECDVTFTRDRELVCRHSQCDLHTTTDILATPLAANCSQPFTPADPLAATPAQARCCASDITLAEFKTLRGKMNGANRTATSVGEYLAAMADYRTPLQGRYGSLLSHRESIEMLRDLGVKMIPELKSAEVPMPFQGDYSQADYAQQLIDEYRAAGVPADDVFVQSFSLADIDYWIANEPEFARQAVLLDGRYMRAGFDHRVPQTWSPGMPDLVARGVRILAPPMWMLLESSDREIRPSLYAQEARRHGLDLIAWTLERSGPLKYARGPPPTFYYQTVADQINNDGDMYRVLNVLAREVGIRGMFSDWPATVTYYTSCLNR